VTQYCPTTFHFSTWLSVVVGWGWKKNPQLGLIKNYVYGLGIKKNEK